MQDLSDAEPRAPPAGRPTAWRDSFWSFSDDKNLLLRSRPGRPFSFLLLVSHSKSQPFPQLGQDRGGNGDTGRPSAHLFPPLCLCALVSGSCGVGVGGTRGQGRRGDVTARKSRWAPVETPGRGDLLHAGCPQSWSSGQFPRAASLSAANQVA